NAEQPANLGTNAVSSAPSEDASELAAASQNKVLSEPKGPIDPKSVEAAGQVVQHYGALIERAHWLKAERLWGDLNLARAFATELPSQFSEVHLEIGDFGETEGAAGSIYTTMPVTFYGKSRRDSPVRKPASIILRRVNDVPGSSEAER